MAIAGVSSCLVEALNGTCHQTLAFRERGNLRSNKDEHHSPLGGARFPIFGQTAFFQAPGLPQQPFDSVAIHGPSKSLFPDGEGRLKRHVVGQIGLNCPTHQGVLFHPDPFCKRQIHQCGRFQPLAFGQGVHSACDVLLQGHGHGRSLGGGCVDVDA